MNILNHETLLELFQTYYLIFLGCLFIGTFALTFYLIPKVLWVSKEKNLMATVNDRSAHVVATPSFGGVAFYITLILVLCILQSLRVNFTGNHLIAAMTILFMVGLKDDLVISTARVKLFGQITATCFVIFSPELQLTNLQGFWGVHEIPEALGFIIKALFMIALINAYNLIDGIDGLAALTGIVISGVFATIFFLAERPYFVLLSLSLAGILTAFLRFNFSRGNKKIFMGDSGSLIVGLTLGFLGLKILVMVPSIDLIEAGHNPANRFLLLGCVLFLPVFDTLRVMLIRMLRGRSPFSADRNHAHHVLLDLGFSHKRAGFSLALTNLLIIGSYFYLSLFLSHLWLSFYVVLIYGTGFLVLYRLRIIVEGRALPTHTEYRQKEQVKPVGGVKVTRAVLENELS